MSFNSRKETEFSPESSPQKRGFEQQPFVMPFESATASYLDRLTGGSSSDNRSNQIATAQSLAALFNPNSALPRLDIIAPVDQRLQRVAGGDPTGGVQKDAFGRPEFIVFGPDKNARLERDQNSQISAIHMHTPKGDRSYIKEGNRWMLDTGGMRVPLPGGVEVSGRGDIAVEVSPGLWQTETVDRGVIMERANANGSRAAVNDLGTVDRILRKNGSAIEVEQAVDGQPLRLKEYSADGMTQVTWTRQQNGWQSSNGDRVRDIQLLANGLTVFTNTDNSKQIIMGDGRPMVERPGQAKFTFDQNGRFESITYPDGDSLQFKYDAQGKICEITQSTNGKVTMVQTRIGDNKWQMKDGTGKDRGTFNGEYTVTDSGEFRFKDLSAKNKEGLWTVIKPDGTKFQEKVNADGSKQIKTADRTTVDIDANGQIRKVSKSKDDYRTFDWENGQIVKITDYQKGKQPAVWDARNDMGQRRNLKVMENGDVAYVTPDGKGVIEKGNLSRIDLDERGRIVKVTQPNGNHRDFTYGLWNGQEQLIAIADVKKNGNSWATETWTRQPGSGQDTWVSSKGGQPRLNLTVGRDGDMRYQSKDGKWHIAKAGREAGEGGLSESVEEARENLFGIMEGHLTGKRLARFKKMAAGFEKRMSDRMEAEVAGGLSAEKVQAETEKTLMGAYDQLGQMVTKDGKTFYDKKTRAFLAENAMFLFMDPASQNQGGHGTCWAEAGIISGGLIPHADHMARLIKEISFDGSYTALNGGEEGKKGPKKFNFSRRLLSMGREEGGWTIDRAYQTGGRSPVGLIFDQVIPHFIRSEGESSSGGWYEGKGGIRNMMYMVTGKIVEHRNVSGTRDVSNDKKTLLQKGGFITYNPGHMRSRHLVKEGNKWVIVQDDQHGNGNDRVIYELTGDLKGWHKKRVDRKLARIKLEDCNDKGIGTVTPNGPNKPKRHNSEQHSGRRHSSSEGAHETSYSAPSESVAKVADHKLDDYRDKARMKRDPDENNQITGNNSKNESHRNRPTNPWERPHPKLWHNGHIMATAG